MNATDYERRPILVVFKQTSAIKETYAGRDDTVALEAHHLVPRGRPSRTLLLFMHPAGNTQYLPMVSGFARAGVHVLSCNSRYPRNDSALIMEKVALDLGACMRHAREKLGYEKVVLAGWSGGGSLSLFYKAQAEQSGKPEPIQEKMAVGRLEKYYREVCLVEQSFVKDPDKSVAQLVAETAKATGKDLAVVRFDRFVLGESAEKASAALEA